MKLVRIRKHKISRCRACGWPFAWLEKAWKVSEGCNPKYYHLECKPKEY